MFDFDFSQVPEDPTKIHDGGGNRPDPGRGMALITDFKEYGAVNGTAHELTLELVAWIAPGNDTKIHKENIFTKDTSGKGFPMKRMTCLCMAAGLFNANDVARWKRESSTPQIDLSKLVGRPVMVELVSVPSEKDPSKTYINIGNIGLAIYHIKDPKVKDWPRNQSIYNSRAALVGEWVTELEKPKTNAAAASPDPFAGVV